MTTQFPAWMPDFFLALALTQFTLGIVLLVTQCNFLKQILGIKIMLQGVALLLISEGWRRQDLAMVEALVISAFIVEAVVLAVALSLLIQLAKKSGSVDLVSIQNQNQKVRSIEEYD